MNFIFTFLSFCHKFWIFSPTFSLTWPGHSGYHRNPFTWLYATLQKVEVDWSKKNKPISTLHFQLREDLRSKYNWGHSHIFPGICFVWSHSRSKFKLKLLLSDSELIWSQICFHFQTLVQIQRCWMFYLEVFNQLFSYFTVN